ncbi:MAG TPA: dihydrolipoamide acetyltransferase family protein, partial [Gemmataceae bacterium]|nr:dihydrolipoamide acetyltransferase family protein [Gemmataceae bacterium]
MAIPIMIPRLGWNMEEGVFQGWLKKDGDEVKPGDALFRLEAEKATEDIESMDSGILRITADGPKEGDTVAVGAVIGCLAGAGEIVYSGQTVSAPALPEPQVASLPGSEPTPRASHLPTASPRARRVAREMGVDWTKLTGSGRTGRIRERDVRAAAAQAPAPQARATPISPMRRLIAERMTASLRSTAPVTLTTTADASNLVSLRNQFKATASAGEKIIPGYTDFLVKLAAAALQNHPQLAARWTDEAIVPPASIDIGVAVEVEDGLLVPVVRDVPQLSLRQAAASIHELAQQARGGSLKTADMDGGVFTITNLGAYGVDAFTPIISY